MIIMHCDEKTVPRKMAFYLKDMLERFGKVGIASMGYDELCLQSVNIMADSVDISNYCIYCLDEDPNLLKSDFLSTMAHSPLGTMPIICNDIKQKLMEYLLVNKDICAYIKEKDQKCLFDAAAANSNYRCYIIQHVPEDKPPN